MSILRICMQRWDILAFLIALSVGISVAANGGVSIQNTSSNVRTNMTGEVSTGKTASKYSYPAVSPRAPKATTNATRPNVTAPEVVAYKADNTKTNYI
jgi:hypothetical protein